MGRNGSAARRLFPVFLPSRGRESNREAPPDSPLKSPSGRRGAWPPSRGGGSKADPPEEMIHDPHQDRQRHPPPRRPGLAQMGPSPVPCSLGGPLRRPVRHGGAPRAVAAHHGPLLAVHTSPGIAPHEVEPGPVRRLSPRRRRGDPDQAASVPAPALPLGAGAAGVAARFRGRAGPEREPARALRAQSPAARGGAHGRAARPAPAVRGPPRVPAGCR